MTSENPVPSWLETNSSSLRERWASVLVAQLARVGKLVEQDKVFDRTHALVLALNGLVPATGPSGEVDARFKAALGELKRLQTDERLTAAEIVVLLFAMRDTLRSANADTRRADTGKTEAPVDVEQLCRLLTRLGLVFLEITAGPREDIDGAVDSNLDYALRYERARQMAITDSLTGLHNFGYFKERLTEERRRAERYQRLLSLIIFDLDHFKRYNDSHGHPAGNEVLREVASILRQEARETDLVARYGGEELVIVLPETNRKTGWNVAERIRERVRRTVFLPRAMSKPEQVTLSAGVATFPVDAIHEDELIARADASLYAAKASGRDRVIAYEPPHKVTISYHADAWVEQVALVGNFNNWDKDADPMTRRADGVFEFVISLNPGSYRYKFVLNGSSWTPDPANPSTQSDDMGGVNSMLVVTEANAEPTRA